MRGLAAILLVGVSDVEDQQNDLREVPILLRVVFLFVVWAKEGVYPSKSRVPDELEQQI
jgi:hypothetical protein